MRYRSACAAGESRGNEGWRHRDALARRHRRQALPSSVPRYLQLHRRLKAHFDPHGIFNPGRLHRRSLAAHDGNHTGSLDQGDRAGRSPPSRDLRSCVHCGFCNATCPTYQLLGDELDGPRGRIYQIKQVLEGSCSNALACSCTWIAA